MKTKVKKIEDRIANQLIAPYNTIVRIGNSIVFLGRGSFGCIHRCIFFNQNLKEAIAVANIGQYCQVNATSQILIGGEHLQNEEIVNTFSESSHLLESIKNKNSIATRSKGIIKIGNNVVVSAGSTILSGATIGNNVIIAAGSVVNGKVNDNTIVGGVPAKQIKTIKNPLFNWWDWVEQDIVEYFNNKKVINPKKYQLQNLHLVFDASINSEGKATNFNLIGLMKSKEFIPIANFTESQLAYFSDAKNKNEYMTISDEVFDDML